MTVELLCLKAGKTKGSFYFHFENMDTYFVALAERWLDVFTLALIDESQQCATPKERLGLLNSLAIKLDARVEQGMRSLATREDSIRKICGKVDKARLEYLTQLYFSTGKFSETEANEIATIEYAAMVGYQQIRPDASERESALMYQALLRMTGRE